MTFQPRRTTGILVVAGGLKPAQHQVPMRRWTGGNVQIASVKAAEVQVGPNGVSIAPPAAARVAQVAVTAAGGAR